MKSISEVIQGSEDTLFNRVLFELQLSGCSKRVLQNFEQHQGEDTDTLIDVAYTYLGAVGYY